MNLKTTLLSHQVQAVEKLKYIKVGALYMEMGTGKTRTALELINIRMEKGKIDHVLWFCPCSVKKNLEVDLEYHAEYKNMITICGIETMSSSIRTIERLNQIVSKKRCYLVVDESNLVKNHEAIRTKRITDLSKKCEYKLILNGTPVTRTQADLFSQWFILDWRILGYKSFWRFAANHIEYDEQNPKRVRRCLHVDYLVKKIAPYSYQIKKDECLNLPDKSYETIYYRMEEKQADHYDDVADELMFDLDEMSEGAIYKLFTALQDVVSGFLVDTSGKHLKTSKFFEKNEENPRLCCLKNIIKRIEQKTIIFCKYTQEIIDIIELIEEIYGQGSAVRFDGKISQKQRNKNIEAFRKDAQFLVANKVCGCYGLNLQFCSYIIFYSNDWDYGTRVQAEDRVHRIGQNKNVHIVDICADYTLDVRIIRCLEKKEGLVDSFKKELEEQKDNQEWLRNWVCGGRNKQVQTNLLEV